MRVCLIGAINVEESSDPGGHPGATTKPGHELFSSQLRTPVHINGSKAAGLTMGFDTRLVDRRRRGVYKFADRLGRVCTLQHNLGTKHVCGEAARGIRIAIGDEVQCGQVNNHLGALLLKRFVQAYSITYVALDDTYVTRHRQQRLARTTAQVVIHDHMLAACHQTTYQWCPNETASTRHQESARHTTFHHNVAIGNRPIVTRLYDREAKLARKPERSMCGIVGMYRYGHGERGISLHEVMAVRDAMTRRGPDGAGLWQSQDRRTALAHRRLAIIATGPQGAQPMELAPRCDGTDTSLVVTFNGEIYNHGEIRRALERIGHRFSSVSDTEVLLHLYEEYGAHLVDHLRGMYAFAIFDGKKHEMLLAHDPLGIKPLYVADDGDTVRVASQCRALLMSSSVSSMTNDAALAGLLIFGSVPEPLTAWAAIRALPPGFTVTIHRDGTRTLRQFYSLTQEISLAETVPPAASTDDLVRDVLVDSVRAHLISDVPVGVFLSSGIDSSAILGLAAEQLSSLRAYTLGFDEFSGTDADEVPLARFVSQTYGASHTVDFVTQEAFSSSLPVMLADMDQPTFDGLNTWLISRSAANHGLKVALSGLGGDEFFGGYLSFFRVPKLYERLHGAGHLQGLGRLSRRISYPFLRRTWPTRAGTLEYGNTLAHVWLLERCTFAPWEIQQILGPERAEASLLALDIDSILASALTPAPQTAVGVVAALEGGLSMRNQLLRDSDWAGMAHSLEIRVPLVDSLSIRPLAGVLTQASSLAAGKHSLGIAPRPPLPTAVTARPKTGFAVPMAERVVSRSEFDDWKAIRLLAHPRCKWIRRWSYVVANQFRMI